MARTREFDEDFVIAEAARQFRQKGYQRMSMAEVAANTGVLRGSLYNAYRNKEVLFLKVYQHYSDTFLNDVQKALIKGTLKQRLTGYFKVAVKNMRPGSTSPGCLTTRVIMEAAEDNELIKEAIRDFLARLENMIENVLTDARSTGEFVGDPRATAKMFVALTRGVAVLERIYTDEKQLWQVINETIRVIARTD